MLCVVPADDGSEKEEEPVGADEERKAARDQSVTCAAILASSKHTQILYNTPIQTPPA